MNLNQYFKILQNGVKNNHVKLEEVLWVLYETPSRKDKKGHKKAVQFSFCTKLCHMIDPHKPIYDSLIREFYFFSEPDSTKPSKQIEQYINFHRFLTSEYQRILISKLLLSSIVEFRRYFASYSCNLTDEKTIDFLIWGFVKFLKKDAIIDQTVIYT